MLNENVRTPNCVFVIQRILKYLKTTLLQISVFPDYLFSVTQKHRHLARCFANYIEFTQQVKVCNETEDLLKRSIRW